MDQTQKNICNIDIDKKNVLVTKRQRKDINCYLTEWYIILSNDFPNERYNLQTVEKNSTALANTVKLCHQSLPDDP